jgi:dihydroneopterin triphosphate diphosphatase
VTQTHKIPISTLIVIHTPELQVLLLERADHPGFWQSVTGSKDSEQESLRDTAIREVREETGLDANQFTLTDWHKQTVYDIYPIWQHRYAPGVLHNTEHVFGLQLPTAQSVKIAPREHLSFIWLPYQQAAEKVFSQSNREAIVELPTRTAARVKL